MLGAVSHDGHRRYRQGVPASKGIQCYRVVATAHEDVAKSFGAHSDQERILEEAIYKRVNFRWTAVTFIVGTKR